MYKQRDTVDRINIVYGIWPFVWNTVNGNCVEPDLDNSIHIYFIFFHLSNAFCSIFISINVRMIIAYRAKQKFILLELHLSWSPFELMGKKWHRKSIPPNCFLILEMSLGVLCKLCFWSNCLFACLPACSPAVIV